MPDRENMHITVSAEKKEEVMMKNPKNKKEIREYY